MNKITNLVLFYCDRMQGFFGLGTHMAELVNYLKEDPAVKITIVFTETDKYAECTTVTQDGIDMIFVPCPENGLFLANDNTIINKSLAQRIIQLVYPYLRHQDNMVCWFNSIGELHLLKQVKDYFNCKILYVHHAWAWKDYRNVADDVFSAAWKNGDIDLSREAFSMTLDQLDLVEYSDKTIAVTNQARLFFSRHLDVDADKLMTIYNGIQMPDIAAADKEAIRKELGIGQQEKIILYSGRVIPNKGVIPMVEAFKQLITKHPDCRLVIAGTGNLAEVLKAAMPHWSKIILTDYLTKDWVKKWCAIADIGILPSFMEQCSFTSIEMRWWKVPLIVSGVDGLDEMFDDDVDCLKIPVEYDNLGNRRLNPEHLYTAMDRLLTDASLQQRLAATGYLRARENFGFEKMRDAYLEVIKSLHTA